MCPPMCIKPMYQPQLSSDIYHGKFRFLPIFIFPICSSLWLSPSPRPWTCPPSQSLFLLLIACLLLSSIPSRSPELSPLSSPIFIEPFEMNWLVLRIVLCLWHRQLLFCISPCRLHKLWISHWIYWPSKSFKHLFGSFWPQVISFRLRVEHC